MQIFYNTEEQIQIVGFCSIFRYRRLTVIPVHYKRFTVMTVQYKRFTVITVRTVGSGMFTGASLDRSIVKFLPVCLVLLQYK